MEIPRSARRPAPHALLLAGLAAAALAAAAIPLVDLPVARLVAGFEPHELWAEGIELLEGAIGWPVHPLLVSAVLAAAAVAAAIAPSLRAMAPAAMFVAGTHVFSRYAVGELKDQTGRLRPSEWLAQGGAAPWGAFHREGIAFPSGHVMLFASIAIPVAVLWPRASWVLAIPVFVAAARVAVNAHYVSDALGAIAVVCILAWLVGLGARPVLAQRA